MKQLRKNKQTRNAIIKTLCYSDIFDYPLTSQEIYKFLSSSKKVSPDVISNTLLELIKDKILERTDEYYFLSGRKIIASFRDERKKESVRKFRIARQAVKVLRHIPTIKLIGLSGSLAVSNSKKTDDIDFFIITSANSLWITRFFVNITLSFMHLKRMKEESFGTDRICPNMFVAENNLKIKTDRQNIFSAREVIQMNVLYEKKNIYKKFMFENSWICKFLANAKMDTKFSSQVVHHNKLLSAIDTFFYAIQFLYMSRHITNEEVRPTLARFHPNDRMNYVLELYELKYEKYLKSVNKERVILQDIDINSLI